MHIRKSNLEDLENTNSLLAACYPALMKDAYSTEILSAAIPIISKAQPQLLSSGTYFVAQSPKGDIIGCGGWTLNSPNNDRGHKPDIGHIRHFATHPDYVRLGIAKSIFQLCKTQALEHSVKSFECFASLNAEDFYKSLGFSTIERIEIPLKHESLREDVTFPCLHMKFILS